MNLPPYTPPPSAKAIVQARSEHMQQQNNLSKGGGKIEHASTGSPASDANVAKSVEMLSRMDKVNDAQNTIGGRRTFRRRRRRRRTFRRRRRR